MRDQWHELYGSPVIEQVKRLIPVQRGAHKVPHEDFGDVEVGLLERLGRVLLDRRFLLVPFEGVFVRLMTVVIPLQLLTR